MMVVSAFFQAKEGKESELEQAFKSMFPLVGKETGLVTYSLNRSKANPGRFFFFERYKDKKAFDSHSSTPHFKELFGKLKDLTAGAPVVEFYEQIDIIER
jgi:quinol monooxygenase YgiN